jgi:hypothetical protein
MCSLNARWASLSDSSSGLRHPHMQRNPQPRRWFDMTRYRPSLSSACSSTAADTIGSCHEDRMTDCASTTYMWDLAAFRPLVPPQPFPRKGGETAEWRPPTEADDSVIAKQAGRKASHRD